MQNASYDSNTCEYLKYVGGMVQENLPTHIDTRREQPKRKGDASHPAARDI